MKKHIGPNFESTSPVSSKQQWCSLHWRKLTLEISASLVINLRVDWILSAHRWISIFHLPIQPFHQCSAACETFNPSQLGQKRAFYERGLGLFLALNCPSSYLLMVMVGSDAPSYARWNPSALLPQYLTAGKWEGWAFSWLWIALDCSCCC